jgi:hypothetical protein
MGNIVRGREERRPAAAARRTIGRSIVVVECEVIMVMLADSAAPNSLTRKLPHRRTKASSTISDFLL